MNDDAPVVHLIELVDQDYQRTTAFIESIVGTGVTTRGWAVTLWLGLLGFGFDRQLWQLGALAVIVTLVLAIVDAYHATLYGQALDHAREAEDISAMYFALLNHGDDDPNALDEISVRLAGYRHGLYTNLWTFRLRDVWYARPTVFFRLVYPTLIVVAVAAAVLAPHA